MGSDDRREGAYDSMGELLNFLKTALLWSRGNIGE